MSERLHPVKALHTDEVWKGRAATFSRVRLHRVIGNAVHHCDNELRTVVQALRSEAVELQQEAAALRRQAAAEAERAAAAAQAAAMAAAAAARNDRLSAVGVVSGE